MAKIMAEWHQRMKASISVWRNNGWHRHQRENGEMKYGSESSVSISRHGGWRIGKAAA
jgi:hypothetical protein